MGMSKMRIVNKITAAAVVLAVTGFVTGPFTGFAEAGSVSRNVYTSYPGFLDRDALVESSTDKGLITEIILRCSRENNKIRIGMMTYSKIEGLFCSSTLKCYRDSAKAVDETCGF